MPYSPHTDTVDNSVPSDVSQISVLSVKADEIGNEQFKKYALTGFITRVIAGIGNATTAASGLLSTTDKTKLDGIATGATANATDAQLRDRSTHTGTQPSTTISDFSEAIDDRVAALLQPGANITFGYDDANNTITIGASGGGAGGIGLGDLSATAPLQYNSGNGQFSFNSTGFLQTSAIGSTVQGYDADLASIAALTPTSGQFLKGNGTGYTIASLTAADIPSLDAAKITSGTFADSLIPASIARDAEVSSAIAALSSVYQPLDSDLTSIASLAPNNNQFIRGNGTTWAVGLLAASDIPNLDAAKITTGTFTDDRFPASITRDSEVESLARAAFSFQSPIEFNGLTGAVTLNGESLGVQLASNVSITGGSISGVAASPTTFVLPTAALAANGQIRRNTNAVEYRDSTSATRILLNNLDNLANLGNITTARSNLKAIGSDNTGIAGATLISNAVFISQANYDALATKDSNTVYFVS